MTDYTATETRVSTAGFDLGATGITPPSNPNRRGVFLADVVVELGLADQETIDQAQRAAQETERSLERYLLEAEVLDEDGLSRAIAERNGLDHVDLDEFEVDMDAAQMVARSAAERYRAVPVASASDGALIVAVQDPFDTLGISDIEVMTRSQVRPAIATGSGIDALIEQLPEHAVSPPPVEQRATVEAMDETIVDPDEGSNGAGPPRLLSRSPSLSRSPRPRPSPGPERARAGALGPGRVPRRVRGGPEQHSEEPEFEVVQFPEPEPEPEPDLEPELESARRRARDRRGRARGRRGGDRARRRRGLRHEARSGRAAGAGGERGCRRQRSRERARARSRRRPGAPTSSPRTSSAGSTS